MRQSRGESRRSAQGNKGIKRLLDDKGDNFYNNINNLRGNQHPAALKIYNRSREGDSYLFRLGELVGLVELVELVWLVRLVRLVD